MFIVKMADHDGNHRCLIEKNVLIALILPSRWQYGAESLGPQAVYGIVSTVLDIIFEHCPIF